LLVRISEFAFHVSKETPMHYTRLIPLSVLLACLFVATPALSPGQDKDDKITCRIIYVPTPQPVVDKMLDMAKVTQSDVVFDLGCGDGRIVATAAKKHGARGVGVDIDPDRMKDCKATLEKMGATKIKAETDAKGITKLTAEFEFKGKPVAVEYRRGDALKVSDLDKATVIQLYMLPEFMEKLEPQALKKLPKGARIVAHDYAFPTWKQDSLVEFQGPDRTHTLYMWTKKD
jgi:SAM-dependent methyltransferase